MRMENRDLNSIIIEPSEFLMELTNSLTSWNWTLHEESPIPQLLKN
jgi:hypothetical protein